MFSFLFLMVNTILYVIFMNVRRYAQACSKPTYMRLCTSKFYHLILHNYNLGSFWIKTSCLHLLTYSLAVITYYYKDTYFISFNLFFVSYIYMQTGIACAYNKTTVWHCVICKKIVLFC